MNSIQNCAIVLGGTNPHINLIKKLKERGFYTVLIDFFPEPPAKRFADEHIQESTMDREKVLDIASAKNASLVISTNIDHANTVACWVAEKLNLPHPYSYETSLNVTDKSRMKKIMKENGISTSEYQETDSLESINFESLKYPVIIKPADSNGSRGVHRCNSKEDILKFFQTSLNESKSHKVIIERFITGPEVSFYYFIENGNARYITSNQRFKYNNKGSVIQSAGGIYPAPQPEHIYHKMQENANRIAKAFSLDNTPVFIQAIIENEEIFILEFAPRIGGGLSYRLIETENRFDIINATINSFLGRTNNLCISPMEGYAAVMNIYAPDIIMGRVLGLQEVINEKHLAEEFYQYKMEGSKVSDDMSSGSRIGGFFIKGASPSEIHNKILQINSIVEVYDKMSIPSMRHDIYTFE